MPSRRNVWSGDISGLSSRYDRYGAHISGGSSSFVGTSTSPPSVAYQVRSRLLHRGPVAAIRPIGQYIWRTRTRGIGSSAHGKLPVSPDGIVNHQHAGPKLNKYSTGK